MIEGKPEYEVTMVNSCNCTQLNVKVNCKGFNTVEEVDPTIFSKEEGTGLCLLKNGQPIYRDETIKFKYAWDASVDFTPAIFTQACS
ncbi:hypothetical protein BVC80_9041g56 [Macleaya cordata]|uniref:Uncharacterized protein n=1 Tax=Macleaya cordata TaxID=56857 RepID=A0A200R2U5_MACCD|nr:hypothetical protein BVC80_9041g56 [Macleaya cordata]